jgi:hypothetical protein
MTSNDDKAAGPPAISANPEAVRWRNDAILASAAIVRSYFGDNGRFCIEDILSLMAKDPSGDPPPAPVRLTLG